MEPELAKGQSATAGKEKKFSLRSEYVLIQTGIPQCHDALQRKPTVLQPLKYIRNKGLT